MPEHDTLEAFEAEKRRLLGQEETDPTLELFEAEKRRVMTLDIFEAEKARLDRGPEEEEGGGLLGLLRGLGRFGGVAGQGERWRSAFTVAKAHPPTGLPLVPVVMEASSLGRVGGPVPQNLHAQGVTVKSQGFVHIPDADPYMGNSGGIHSSMPSP